MFGKEPAVILGLVGALIALGVGFGLPVTAEQAGLITAAVSAVLALVVRSQVIPAINVVAQVTDGQVVAGRASHVADGRQVQVTPVPRP